MNCYGQIVGKQKAKALDGLQERINILATKIQADKKPIREVGRLPKTRQYLKKLAQLFSH